jgi:alanyl-tRNA synthetase
MRVSGKHNDFSDVGHSLRHHTFFEMLGNFSFGDYFKDGAVRLAWKFVTEELGLPRDRLWITVFETDDEAAGYWRQHAGVAPERIVRIGEKDNFWAMGDTGPCGPCSEIHYDFGKSPLPDHGDCDLTCACGRWVEVWNLVFMQYNRDASGETKPLPSPSIDTGMGFERVATILQGKTSNYDNDLFQPLLMEISGMCGHEYGTNPGDDVSMRVIADHTRAAAFAVGDGQYPGNDKRGYVIRKILRRAMVHGKRLGINEPFLCELTGKVVEQMGGAYPELVTGRETIARVIRQEEESFAGTLGEGLKDFNDRARKIKSAGSRTLSGDAAFFLYDTRGLPREIIEDLARENGLAVDAEGFTKAFESQRERSRQDYHSGKVRELASESLFDGETRFTGYETSGTETGTIRALLKNGERGVITGALTAGESGEIVLAETPFYAESGGQAGDAGCIEKDGARARVLNTIYRGTAVVHSVEIESGTFYAGDAVTASVDMERRRRTMRNHTATHLLQAALRETLGAHVKQAGSAVSPERLRFDFTHYAALSREEIRKIEDIVNNQVWLDIKVDTTVMNLDEAMRSGAMALFGEKYQENVRVVTIAGFSRELCGGTHVPATGAVGLFKIVGESGIAAGVRRIEAITGAASLDRFRSDEDLLDEIQQEYKVARTEIIAMIEKLQKQARDLERQALDLKAQSARAGLGDILARVREIGGVKVLAAAVPAMDRSGLRNLADELKQKIGHGVVVLGSPQEEGKAALVVMVTPDVCKRAPAGQIIKQIAPLVGGNGGGKPELAEAGGKDASRLSEAIGQSYEIIEKLMM